MISSQQVSAMMMQQQQMHASLTSHPGMAGAMPAQGASTYPPQWNYGVHQATGGTGAGLAAGIGAGVGAVPTVIGGIGTTAAIGTMFAGGGGMLGAAAMLDPIAAGLTMGSAAGGFTAAGLAVGGLATGGVAAGLYGLGKGAGQFAGGVSDHLATSRMFQQRAQFANPAAYGGRGYAPQDMGRLTGAMQKFAYNDPFTTMSDAKMSLQRFTDFNMDQGVRDADELSKRVVKMTESLRDMARTMGSTMEEAGRIFGGFRQAGLYTSADVMGGTISMNQARGFGMSSGQFQGMQQGGAATARGMGMTGGAGATFTTNRALDLMQGVQAGTLTDTQLMDITGAPDAATAIQQLSGQMLGNTAQFGRSAAGRALLGAVGTQDASGRFTGGVDSSRLASLGRGNMGLGDLSGIAGPRTQGSRTAVASFSANQTDIMDSLLREEGGMDAIMQLISQSASDISGGDDAIQREMEQLIFEQMGLGDRRLYRTIKELTANMPELRRRRMRERMREERTAAQMRYYNENITYSGKWQQFTGSIGEDIFEPIAQAGSRGSANIQQNWQEMWDSVHGVSRMQIRAGQAEEYLERQQASYALEEGWGTGERERKVLRGMDLESTGAISGLNVSDFSRQRGAAQGYDIASFREALRPALIQGRQVQMKGARQKRYNDLIYQANITDDPETRAEALKEAMGMAATDLGIMNAGLEPIAGDVHAAVEDPDQAAIRAIMSQDDAAASAFMKAFADADPGTEGGRFATQKAAQKAMKSALGLSESEEMMFSGLRTAGGAVAGGLGIAFLASNPVGWTVAGGAAGVAGIVGLADWAYESDDEALMGAIDRGEGTFLIGKLKDTATARRIDEILVQASNEPGDTSEAEVKLLRRHFGDNSITAADVRALKLTMTRVTGEDTPQNRIDAGSSAYRKLKDKAQIFAAVDEQRVVTEQLQAAGSLAQGLDTSGMSDEMVTAVSKFSDLGRSTAMTGTTLVRRANQLAKLAGQGDYQGDSSTFGQLVELSGQAYRDVLAVETQADLEEMVGEEQAKALMARTGVRRGTGGLVLGMEDKERLAEMYAGGQLASLASQGAGAEMALQEGLSPVERQNRNIEKQTELIDALYSRASGDNPITPGGRRILANLPEIEET